MLLSGVGLTDHVLRRCVGGLSQASAIQPRLTLNSPSPSSCGTAASAVGFLAFSFRSFCSPPCSFVCFVVTSLGFPTFGRSSCLRASVVDLVVLETPPHAQYKTPSRSAAAAYDSD